MFLRKKCARKVKRGVVQRVERIWYEGWLYDIEVEGERKTAHTFCTGIGPIRVHNTSGSIDEEQLRYFLGIVKHEARNAFEVYCIPWDAEAYEVLKAHNPREVASKVARKMKGGGGTVIKPCLEKTYRLVRPGDAVIILTDGDILDKDEEEAKLWFRRLANKAGFAMIGYTTTPVEAPGFLERHLTFRVNSRYS